MSCRVNGKHTGGHHTCDVANNFVGVALSSAGPEKALTSSSELKKESGGDAKNPVEQVRGGNGSSGVSAVNCNAKGLRAAEDRGKIRGGDGGVIGSSEVSAVDVLLQPLIPVPIN